MWAANKVHSYSHLALTEREEIAIGIELGHSKRRIARTLKRNVSTITRECSRNKPPSNKVKYRASQAHLRSKKRQKEIHRRERLKSEATRHYVAEKWVIGWTHELIAGRIKHEGLLALGQTTNLFTHGCIQAEKTSSSTFLVPIESVEKEAPPNTNTPLKSLIESPLKTDLLSQTRAKNWGIGRRIPLFPDRAKGLLPS